MGNKLSWNEIKAHYDGEWVELIDYDWPEGAPVPKAGIVRVHAPSRKAFYQLAKQNAPEDSAILFVGKIELTHGAVGEAREGYRLKVAGLSFLGLRFKAVHIGAIDFDLLTEDQIDSLLGFDLIKQLHIELDGPQGVLRIYPSPKDK